MNIFVLNTGRCGSTTFIRACQHISNLTSAHESRCGLLGEERFRYPDDHIEADNRLSWFLGRLDQHYGDNAFYVHLRRNDNDTARSCAKRYYAGTGIIHAYRTDILMGLAEEANPMSVSLDYCETVTTNIELFLKDKTRQMPFNLETAKQDFALFWKRIGAQGDLEAAVREFDTAHNASDPNDFAGISVQARARKKMRRILRNLPNFLKSA